MGLIDLYRKWRKRNRDRIYGGPSVDGGVRHSCDTDAPKEIRCRSLIAFSCRFSAVSLGDEEVLRGGIYTFTAERREDGVYTSAEVRRRVGGGLRTEAVRPFGVFREIDTLMRKYDVAAHNGRFYSVSGLPGFYGASLRATYASGERIDCSNNQDPFLPAAFVRELCDLFDIDPTQVS